MVKKKTLRRSTRPLTSDALARLPLEKGRFVVIASKIGGRSPQVELVTPKIKGAEPFVATYPNSVVLNRQYHSRGHLYRVNTDGRGLTLLYANSGCKFHAYAKLQLTPTLQAAVRRAVKKGGRWIDPPPEGLAPGFSKKGRDHNLERLESARG